MELGGVSSQAGMASSLLRSDTDSQLVTMTLNKLNETGKGMNAISADDQAQRMILNAAYTGKGGNVDSLA